MYKKFLFVFIVFVSFAFFAFAKTLNAGISYTIEIARAKAFDGVPMEIDMKKYQNYLFDINVDENLKAITKSKFEIKDRILTIFNDGDYGVYYPQKRVGFYYSWDGNIRGVTIEFNNSYPIKSAKYDFNGNLISTSLNVKQREDYIFDVNKKLIAHWIGNNCYNEKGELIGTRK